MDSKKFLSLPEAEQDAELQKMDYEQLDRLQCDLSFDLAMYKRIQTQIDLLDLVQDLQRLEGAE